MAPKEPVRFLITGAAGQIGYSLIPLVASGRVLGDDQPVILHLLDIEPAKKTLGGVAMEIEDCAYPLVEGVVATTDIEEGFKGVKYAAFVGGFPRRAGMERKDLLARNSPIFIGQGEALGKFADKDVKVCVVANPANTNCLVALSKASGLNPRNFSALTRLDMNRAKGQLAAKLGSKVKNVIIWGNHSSTQYPDAAHAVAVAKDGTETPVTKTLDSEYLNGEFVTTVQKRGAAVIAARGLSSALSAANACGDHFRSWVQGTAEGEVVSMAVVSDGSYGITEGLIYSFPVTCKDGDYTIVQGLELSDQAKAMLKASEEELIEEKAHAGL